MVDLDGAKEKIGMKDQLGGFMFRMHKTNLEGVREDLVEDLDPRDGSLKVFQVTGEIGDFTYRQLSYS